MPLFGPPNVEKLKAKGDVKGLIKALRYEKDYRVRRDAAKALGKIGDARAVEPLIHALKDHRYDVWTSAAWALGGMGKAAVDPLIPLLKDKDSSARAAAARALGWIRDARVVDLLIQALMDKDTSVRVHVAGALGQIGDPRAVEPLIRALKDEDGRVQRNAVESLGEIGDPRAVEPLIQTLEEAKDVVREAVPAALAKIGGARAVEGLMRRLGHFVVGGKVAAALAEIGEPAVEPLLRRLRDDEKNIEALCVLGRIGDKRALEPLLDYALKGIRRSMVSEIHYIPGSIDHIEEALTDLSHQSALSAEAGKLAVRAVAYWQNQHLALVHTEGSLAALKSLCRFKDPATSNLLYKISQIEDLDFRPTSSYGVDARGTLSFEKHRKLASEELARRGFTTYDPSNYFITE